MWLDIQTWLPVLAIGLGGSICFAAASFFLGRMDYGYNWKGAHRWKRFFRI